MGRSPGEGNGNPLQCYCPENPTDRGAWRATVHGVARVRHDLETKEREREIFKQKLMRTRTQEKGAVTPQETDPDLPLSVQESPAEAGLALACCRVGGTERSRACMGPSEGGRHYLHTSTIVWPQVNSRAGAQPCPSPENWIKDFLSMAPPIRTRPSFPLCQSLPSGSFHKPLSLSIRGQTE